jgi:hypothetical protein
VHNNTFVTQMFRAGKKAYFGTSSWYTYKVASFLTFHLLHYDGSMILLLKSCVKVQELMKNIEFQWTRNIFSISFALQHFTIEMLSYFAIVSYVSIVQYISKLIVFIIWGFWQKIIIVMASIVLTDLHKCNIMTISKSTIGNFTADISYF